MITRILRPAAPLFFALLLTLGGALVARANALEVMVAGQLCDVVGTFVDTAGNTWYQVVVANLPEGAALTEGTAMTVAATDITIVEAGTSIVSLTGATTATGAVATTAAGTGLVVTIVGYAVTGAGVVVAVVQSGQYYYYTGLMSNPGSQPANNMTDYENPANWWQNTISYWSSFFSSSASAAG